MIILFHAKETYGQKATFTSQDANRVIKYPNGTYQLAETSDYTCTPVVISRISEMYLVKAEALGKMNGAATLVEYMKKTIYYRSK